MVKANMGSDESRDYIRAADAYSKKMNFANDSFSTNPAFSPTIFTPNVIDTSLMVRPTIDALGGARALSASGMTIAHPKLQPMPQFQQLEKVNQLLLLRLCQVM